MGTFIYSVCAVWTKSFLFICRRLHAEAEALQPDQSPNIQLERTVHWYRFRRQCSHAQISTSVWFFNSKPSSSRCSTHTCQLLRPAAGEANPPRTLLLLCIDGEEYFSCWPPGHERFECKSQRLHRSKTVLDRRRQKCRYKLYCSLNNLHKSKWLLHTQGWTQPRERNRKRVEWRRHTHPHSAHKALMKSSLHQGCNTAPGQHRTVLLSTKKEGQSINETLRIPPAVLLCLIPSFSLSVFNPVFLFVMIFIRVCVLTANCPVYFFLVSSSKAALWVLGPFLPPCTHTMTENVSPPLATADGCCFPSLVALTSSSSSSFRLLWKNVFILIMSINMLKGRFVCVRDIVICVTCCLCCLSVGFEDNPSEVVSHAHSSRLLGKKTRRDAHTVILHQLTCWGCGWWLACAADNWEGTVYLFCVSTSHTKQAQSVKCDLIYYTCKCHYCTSLHVLCSPSSVPQHPVKAGFVLPVV